MSFAPLLPLWRNHSRRGYALWDRIKDTVDYGFNTEKGFSHKGLSMRDHSDHVAKFTSGIWQIHPFSEGSTRGTTDSRFLEAFFGNLLLGENNEWKNRFMHLDWATEQDNTLSIGETERVTEQVARLLEAPGAYPPTFFCFEKTYLNHTKLILHQMLQYDADYKTVGQKENPCRISITTIRSTC